MFQNLTDEDMKMFLLEYENQTAKVGEQNQIIEQME